MEDSLGAAAEDPVKFANWPVRASAAASLAWERFWPLAVPAACVFLVFASVSWFGLWTLLPAPWRIGAAMAFLAAVLAAGLPLRHFALPRNDEITRRVEISSRLEHRPLTAQVDALAQGDGDEWSLALWREHRRRMAGQLNHLSAGAPQTDANRHDPWALRAFLAAIAFVAFGYSFGPGGGRMADAFSARIDPAEVLSRLDAWVTPPAYTRRAPIYLASNPAPGSPAVVVPNGSIVTLRFVGDNTVSARFTPKGSDAAVEIAPANQPDAAKSGAADTTSASMKIVEFSTPLTANGNVAFVLGEKTFAQWQMDVTADQAPQINFTEPPSAALSGSLQLSYEVADDYGVAAARAIIAPFAAQSADARPLVAAPELPLPLPRNRATSGKAKQNRDLTSHPWAGAKVTITLEAKDDLGQTGLSAPHQMTLPGRNFTHPLALALVEQRRILALDARKQRRVADMLDAMMTAPEEFIPSAATYIAMKTAFRRIVDARTDDQLRSAVDLLWEIALAIENGDLTEAERRLREAQENLSKALEGGASDEEINRLMQELRSAMNDLIEQLTREAMENRGRMNPLDQNQMTQTLRQSDLERMLDRIEDLAKSGSRDAARQLLSEMQRMMDNLRAGRQQQQQQQQGNQLNQKLDELSELMRQQQQLLDETFKMQQQNRQGGQEQQQQNGQQGEQENGSKPMTPQELAEALKNLKAQQEALQQQLGELSKELEGMGLDPSQSFGDAEQQMGEAGENLGQGKTGEATGNQGQALEALRRGVQQMLQQMAGQQRGGQQRGEGDPGQDNNRQDPLGRNQQANGLDEGDDTKVPEEIEAQRAREIMEAIRRRLGNQLSPLIEQKYLERLLDSE
jgi:uncharacterized protein (TIGR02302 family)